MLSDDPYTTLGDLESVGLSEKDARLIYGTGSDTFLLKRYLVSGLTTVAEIQAALEHIVTPDNVRLFRSAISDLPVNKMAELLDLDIYPRHLHVRFGMGVENADIDSYVEELSEAGVTPDDMIDFGRCDITEPQEIRDLSENGVTASLLMHLRSVGAEITREELCGFGMLLNTTSIDERAIAALYQAGFQTPESAGAAYSALKENGMVSAVGGSHLEILSGFRAEIVRKLGNLGERICQIHPGPRYTYQTLNRSPKLREELNAVNDTVLTTIVTLIETNRETPAAEIRALIAAFDD